MAAINIGTWTIAANSGFELFIHGWSPSQTVLYSIIPFPGSGVPNPVGRATLTQGRHSQHVTGTFAHTIHIQNNAPFNTCNARVIAQVESL
jgi:hypothetical protein